MKLFKSIFGKNRINESNKNVDVQNDILENLFIDNEPPLKNRGEVENESYLTIKDFLNRDFFNEGKTDGYNYGTQERCDNKIKLIKANFLLELDKIIDEKNNVIQKIELRKNEIGNLSPVAIINLDLIKNNLQKIIDELKIQKELSVDNEGWIMNALHAYKLGFNEGLLLELKEKEFFKI